MVLIYAVLAAAWIYGSDGLLALILPDPELLTQLSLLKGWLFVAVTSYALYRVLKSGDTPDRPKLLSAAGQRGLPGSATRPDTTPDVAPASDEAGARGLRLMLAGGALLIGLVTAAVMYMHYVQVKQREGARIEAIVQLRAEQVGRWLNGQMSAARFMATSKVMAAQFRSHLDGDKSALPQMLERVDEFSKANGFSAGFVIDETGRASLPATLMAAEPPVMPDADLVDAARRAMASGELVRTQFHSHRTVTSELDLIAPRADFR